VLLLFTTVEWRPAQADRHYLLSCRGRGHLAARFGASTADVRALLHYFVILHGLARFGACDTYLRTDFACPAVELGIEEHEPGTGVTDLGAGEQQLDVLGCGVLAALLETVRDHGKADFLATLAAIDTLLHRRIGVMSHCFLLLIGVFRGQPSPVSAGMATVRRGSNAQNEHRRRVIGSEAGDTQRRNRG
jgi:hypothetical protein